MSKSKVFRKTALAAMVAITMIPVNVYAADVKSIDTGIKCDVYANGQYANWDGVPTVAQFTDKYGNFAFAYKDGSNIKIVLTVDGKPSKKITLKMKGELFGTVTCDEDGFFYAATGTTNTGSNTDKQTVFITKYNSKGKLIKSIGDNGSSSLASYYDSGFYTKTPFSGGTCDIAVNGDYLAIDYGRGMYSGHQSNSVWIINKEKMKTVTPDSDSYWGYANYQSHSFGQRAIPYAGGFAFVGEGDCFDRSFTFTTADMKADTSSEAHLFDFWVQKDTYKNYDMGILNNNFAHIGNLCPLKNGTVSFVASSVKSMNSKAEKEKEQIFIQIFDPSADLTTQSAYITKGKRTGKSGPNGDESATNYGVKWLTDYTNGSIKNPQAVTDGKGNTIVLYERYSDSYQYDGVYRIIVNSKGKVTGKTERISTTAHLNSCETPVYYDGCIYWCENDEGDYTDHALKVYKFSL